MDLMQQIAIANGITEPVNGSWIQAICESLGIYEPVNGSWIQGLAQYGPFGSVATITNTATITDVTYGVPYVGPKGVMFVDATFTIDLGQDLSEEILYYILSLKRDAYFISDGDGASNTQFFDVGNLDDRIFESDPISFAVGDLLDLTINLIDSRQSESLAPIVSLPYSYSLLVNPI